MKLYIQKIALCIALALTTMVNVYAQAPSKVENKVNALVKKYENVKGVDCTTVTKGMGLNMVKMMFNKQFGKEFMKGVTSITIIDYSNAPQQTCTALRKELDAFTTLLKEYNLGNEKEFANNDYIRSFASPIDDKTISDFIVAVENKDSKVIMYMAGKIKVEK